MPDAEAAHRHEGRVSGESRGEGEFTHELVVVLVVLGACARGVRRWEGGGVGQEGNAAAKKGRRGFGFSRLPVRGVGRLPWELGV